jgi:hypothetical protein
MCYPESRGVSSKQALLFMANMRAGLQEFHRNSERKLLNSTFNRSFINILMHLLMVNVEQCFYSLKCDTAFISQCKMTLDKALNVVFNL